MKYDLNLNYHTFENSFYLVERTNALNHTLQLDFLLTTFKIFSGELNSTANGFAENVMDS